MELDILKLSPNSNDSNSDIFKTYKFEMENIHKEWYKNIIKGYNLEFGDNDFYISGISNKKIIEKPIVNEQYSTALIETYIYDDKTIIESNLFLYYNEFSNKIYIDSYKTNNGKCDILYLNNNIDYYIGAQDVSKNYDMMLKKIDKDLDKNIWIKNIYSDKNKFLYVYSVKSNYNLNINYSSTDSNIQYNYIDNILTIYCDTLNSENPIINVILNNKYNTETISLEKLSNIDISSLNYDNDYLDILFINNNKSKITYNNFKIKINNAEIEYSISGENKIKIKNKYNGQNITINTTLDSGFDLIENQFSKYIEMSIELKDEKISNEIMI